MRAWWLSMLVALTLPLQAAEQLSGSNVDVRTLLFLKAPDAAVRKLLPDGWDISPPPGGPVRGYNIGILLIDSVVALDAEGKPAPPFRGAVLFAPARRGGAGESLTMIVGGITAQEATPGAYGVYRPGVVTIERSQRSSPDGMAAIAERWESRGNDGSALEVWLDYARGPLASTQTEQRVYSALNPSYYRIYRATQASDLVRSVPGNVDRATRLAVRATGPLFGSLLDGTEQLVGAISIPSYVRSVYLPQ
jgi:hypothetical protein